MSIENFRWLHFFKKGLFLSYCQILVIFVKLVKLFEILHEVNIKMKMKMKAKNKQLIEQLKRAILMNCDIDDSDFSDTSDSSSSSSSSSSSAEEDKKK